jgi:hypothetical protein
MRTALLGLSASLVVTTGAVFLPDPTGPHNVGSTRIEAIDYTREDPYAPSPQPRDLVLTLFYPTHEDISPNECVLSPHLPPTIATAVEVGYNLANGSFHGFYTRSCLDAPLAHPELPVLLFTPGYGETSLLSSVIMQEMASYGWNVVSVDHPYESRIVEYPDGRAVYGVPGTIPEDLADLDPTDPAWDTWFNGLVSVRVADMISALNALENSTIVSSIPGLAGYRQGSDCAQLKTDNVGIFGQSMGGATALQATADDPRFVAGVNFDGDFRGPVIQDGTDAPFLILASNNHTLATSPSFSEAWSNMRGFKRGYEAEGATHESFSDGPPLRDILGDQFPPHMDALLGPINGTRLTEFERAFTNSLFARFLKGHNDGLLDGEGLDQWPELNPF